MFVCYYVEKLKLVDLKVSLWLNGLMVIVFESILIRESSSSIPYGWKLKKCFGQMSTDGVDCIKMKCLQFHAMRANNANPLVDVPVTHA